MILTRTAERDSALTGATKIGVLEAVRLHVEAGKVIQSDYMDNGDMAYILNECSVEQTTLYVKLKFSHRGTDEQMVVISAHPPRRW